MPNAGIMASSVVASGTDVLLENFTSISEWTGSGISSVVGGRSGNMMQITGTNTARFTIPAINENATLTVGFALKLTSIAAARQFLTLAGDADATNHTTFMVNTDGSIGARLGGTAGAIIGTTATGLIAINTWTYFEAQVFLHDTAGTVKIQLAGTNQLSVAGVDTKFGGTKTVFDTIRLANGGAGVTTNFDDLYLTTGAGAPFKGDITIP